MTQPVHNNNTSTLAAFSPSLSVKSFWSCAFLYIAFIDGFNKSVEKEASAFSKWFFAPIESGMK